MRPRERETETDNENAADPRRDGHQPGGARHIAYVTIPPISDHRRKRDRQDERQHRRGDEINDEHGARLSRPDVRTIGDGSDHDISRPLQPCNTTSWGRSRGW